MRTTTIGSAVALALSGAALAQVASTPVEQKTGQNAIQGNAVDNATSTPTNAADDAATTVTPVNPTASVSGGRPPK